MSLSDDLVKEALSDYNRATLLRLVGYGQIGLDVVGSVFRWWNLLDALVLLVLAALTLTIGFFFYELSKKILGVPFDVYAETFPDQLDKIRGRSNV